MTTDTEVAAYMHKTRMEILRQLNGGPATISQIAAGLKVHPANLTRHVRILLKAGLIVLSETRDTGKNLEKYYQAVAGSFVVNQDASALEEPHKIALQFAISDLSAAISELPVKSEDPVYALIQGARIPKGKIAPLCKAIEKLVKSFESSDSQDGRPYHLNISLYPVASIPDQELEIRLNRTERKNEN